MATTDGTLQRYPVWSGFTAFVVYLEQCVVACDFVLGHIRRTTEIEGSVVEISWAIKGFRKSSYKLIRTSLNIVCLMPENFKMLKL